MEVSKQKIDNMAYILMGLVARGIIPVLVGIIGIIIGIIELVTAEDNALLTASLIIVIASVIQTFMLWSSAYHYVLDDRLEAGVYRRWERIECDLSNIVAWGIPLLFTSLATCFICVRTNKILFDILYSVTSATFTCGILVTLVLPLALVITELYRSGELEPYIVAWERSLFDAYIKRYGDIEKILAESEEKSEDSNRE